MVTMWLARVWFTWSTIAAMRRGPPRAREPGHEDEPRLLVREASDADREPERVEARCAGDDTAEHEADEAALAERTDAEAAEAGHAVHEVGLVLVAELLGARRRHHGERDAFGVVGFDHLEG